MTSSCQRRMFAPCLFLLAVGLGGAATRLAVPPSSPTEELPPAAAKAAGQRFGSLARCKFSRDGIDVFEVEGVAADGALALRVTSAGEIVEEELVVDANRLSVAAKARIESDFPGGVVTRVESVTRRYFEVALTVDGHRRSLEVDATGARIDRPVLPVPVKAKAADEEEDDT